MSDGAKWPSVTKTQGAELEVLLTAQEAYPRLEALFLSARHSIAMGFRLFDPHTRLLSDAGRAIGETWSDLFLHTLNRGVPIDMTVADFDPVMAHEMHEQAWRSVAIADRLNALSVPQAARMSARCVLHPARGGVAPRLMFAAKTRKRLHRIAQDLNNGPDPAGRLRQAPGLKNLLFVESGMVRLRQGALPHLYPVTLHQKMAVFDNAVTYIGGLDLNERRVDDPTHDQPAQDTWHDLQVVTHDPRIAVRATQYLNTLVDVIDRKRQAQPTQSPFLTTLSRRRLQNTFHLAPETISDTIFKEHVTQIRTAKHFIYLETQYFRDRRIVKALVNAGRQNAALRLLVLLPAAPDDVAFADVPGLDGRFGEYLQARALRHVRRAFGTRFLAVSPVQPRIPDKRDVSYARATLAGAPIVYVHSKLSIFDDTAAIVSSANLNGRSMKWDAETGVLLTAHDQVKSLTDKVFGHWLGGYAACGPDAVFNIWADRARQNANIPPDQRTGFIVPHDIKPSAKIGVPVPGAPEELV